MTGNRLVVGLPVGCDRAGLRARSCWRRWRSGSPTWAHAAEGEGSSLIEINWTLGVQLISFLLLLAVLYKLAVSPLAGALEGRTAAIQQQLAEAQAAREEAQRQLGAMEERIRAAQADAQALRERALREAGELRERLSAEARQEAARLVEAAQAQIGPGGPARAHGAPGRGGHARDPDRRAARPEEPQRRGPPAARP